MKVVVTGGAGFIGSHSVEALLDSGAEVTVVDDFSSGKRENLPARHERLHIVPGDIRSERTLRRAFDGASHVLHLAARMPVRPTVDQPIESCRTNVLGFVNVLEAARQVGVRRLVYASSAAVHGEPSGLPLTEASPHGLEKWFNDEYAALYRRQHGLSSMGLRYFNVYGPRQDPRSPFAGVISRFVERALLGQPLSVQGDGLQSGDFVHVGEVAQVNLRALRSDAECICNVGTGRKVTLLEMIESLERVLARPLGCEFDDAVAGGSGASSMRTDRLPATFVHLPMRALESGLRELVAA